jgi:WD40 repeat protein
MVESLEDAMVGLLALATMVLSAASDTDGKEPDLQRALVLAKTLNDPSILADAIVVLGWKREREICTKLEAKAEGSSGETRRFMENVLQACRETPLELVSDLFVDTEISFASGRTLYATGLENSAIKVIDLASRKVVQEIRKKIYIRALAISHDGTRLVLGLDSVNPSDGNILLLNVSSKRTLWRKKYEDWVESFAFSSDGARLAVGGQDGKSLILDVVNGKTLMEVFYGDGYTPNVRAKAMVFSPDGALLAIALSNGKAILVHVSSGKEVFEIPHLVSVNAVAFSPDGTLLVTGSSDGKARVIEVKSGEILFEVSPGDAVVSIAFHPDGAFFSVGSNLGHVLFVDVESRKVVRHIHSVDVIKTAAFSPDGTLFVTASGDEAILWRTPW